VINASSSSLKVSNGIQTLEDAGSTVVGFTKLIETNQELI